MISKLDHKPTSCPDNPLGILWSDPDDESVEEQLEEPRRNPNPLPRIPQADSGPWVLPPEYRLPPLRN